MFLPYIRGLILTAAAAPLVFYAAAIACAWGFFRRRDRSSSGFARNAAPPVSVLKPMHGAYRDTYGNLLTFCKQDYPYYEILFGVNQPDDPAIPVIQRLAAEFPHLPIRLLIGSTAPGSQGLASNDKVGKLCHLAREARYDLFVVSDGDIRVEADYLQRVAAPFSDRSVGAATCLYRGATTRNLWSGLEDLSLTTDFLAGVLVARKLGLSFALGATMAVRRDALEAIGGFEALADTAADDHELGRRVGRCGFGVALATAVPETECDTHDFASYFRHHLRWAVVTRTSQPWGHVGFIFAQSLPWTVVAAILAPSWTIAAAFVAAYLALRLTLAFTLGSGALRDPLVKRKWWLLPFRDALAFVIWFASLFISRVQWQDLTYHVRRGRLVPVGERDVPVPERASTEC